MDWQKPVPKDVLVFKVWLRKLWSGPMMALTADGKEFPLILLGGTPLHRAAYEGRTEEIDALLEKGEPIDARTYWRDTPLSVALKGGQEPAAVRLVDRGADLDPGPTPTQHPRSPLFSIRMLEALARRGVNMNAKDDRGDTPLLRVAGAASSGFKADESSFFSGDDDRKRMMELMRQNPIPQIVAWLLKHGADLNARNKEGKTALHGVAGSRIHDEEVEAARVLLEHGADPNLTDAEGNTALHQLIPERRTCYAEEDQYTGLPAEWQRSSLYQMLLLLVARMRDINVRNANGQTPLDMAVRTENFLSAQFLIDHGANANSRVESGMTLSQLLRKQNDYWKAQCGRRVTKRR